MKPFVGLRNNHIILFYEIISIRQSLKQNLKNCHLVDSKHRFHGFPSAPENTFWLDSQIALLFSVLTPH